MAQIILMVGSSCCMSSLKYWVTARPLTTKKTMKHCRIYMVGNMFNLRTPTRSCGTYNAPFDSCDLLHGHPQRATSIYRRCRLYGSSGVTCRQGSRRLRVTAFAIAADMFKHFESIFMQICYSAISCPRRQNVVLYFSSTSNR